MTEAINSDEFAQELAKAMGLNADQVCAITVVARAGGVIMVNVEMIATQAACDVVVKHAKVW